MFCIVVHKLCLTAGLFPTFNTSAGLLSFVLLRGWTWAASFFGVPGQALAAQE